MYQYKKNISKLLGICFFSLVAAAPAFSARLQSVKTKYFEIIYAESSAPSAALLTEYADGYAEEICAALHQKVKGRIPVYLVSDTEDLNGYFTRSPQRRIVIYDAGSTDGILGNFPDTLLLVFYHELTHALTIDAPFYLLNLLPMSFIEGAAVSFESLHGQGRLHDPLIRQYVIQNKIDGTTPTWKEAASSRDMYPGGLWPYIYGGYFADYLQKVYGMDAYSKLWKLGWRLFIPRKFKSIYDKDVSDAWNQWIATIPLPEKLSEPVPFASQTKKSGYSALAASPDGFAYYDFDRQAVYFTRTVIGNTDNSADVCEPVKLFTADLSLNQLSFSEDGSLLVVSDSVETSGKTSQKRSRIFDMKKRTFIGKPILSSMAACFVDDQTLCSIRLQNQSFSAVLIDRTTQDVKKVLYTAGPGQAFAALYSPCYIGEGQVALIAANGVKRTIFCIDTETGALSSLPEQEAPYAIRYLQSTKSGDEYVLTFSWAEMDMLYRLGLYYPKSGTIKTQQTDISGGVFFPVLLPAHQSPQNDADNRDNHSIIYVGQHGTYHRLYTMEESALAVKTIDSEAVSGQALSNQENIPASTKTPHLELLNPSRYQPLAWLWRPKVRPLINIPANMRRFGGYGIGLKLAMLDPTETIELNSSVLFLFKPFFTQIQADAAYHLRPLSLHLKAFDQLDTKTFTYRTTGFGVGASGVIPLSYSWEWLKLSYSATAAWIAPLSDTGNTYYPFPYKHTVLAHEGQLYYRNVRSSRIIRSPFFAKDLRGVSVSGAIAHAYSIEEKTNAAVVQASLNGYIPAVPIRLTLGGYFGFHARFNPLNGTYSDIAANYPVTETSFFPSFAAYNTAAMQQKLASLGTSTMSGGISSACDFTCFSYEVQTGSFFSPLFINRISFHAGYAWMLTGNFATKAHTGGFLYLDTLYLNCLVTLNSAVEIGLEYTHPVQALSQLGAFRLVTGVKL